MSWNRLGFLDHEGAPWLDLAWAAEVLDVIECAGWQPVDPDAVLVWVDHYL